MKREDRAQELRQLRKRSPYRLIALCRGLVGTSETDPLPAGVSFASMIDAILQQELKTGKLERDSPHAAGAA
jgi:hypothetical protein